MKFKQLKEYVFYHPRIDEVVLYWMDEDGNNNILYSMEVGHIIDVENLVYVCEL